MSGKATITKYLLMITALATFSLKAASPLGGLAVGVSPDGKTVAAAGDNRTLYVMDAEQLTVKHRTWLARAVVQIAFNQSGDKLVTEDTQGCVQLFDVNDGKELGNLPNAANMCAAPAANLLAGVASSKGEIVLHSLADLALKGKIALNKGDRVGAMTFDQEGKRLAVWFEPANDSEEAKDNKTPDGLNKLESAEFKLKHDGKTSWIRVFDAGNGALMWENKLWYSQSASGAQLMFKGDNVLIVNYNNINANIDPKGETTLFETKNSFNYGSGSGGNILLTGGLGNGTYMKVDDFSAVSFKIDKLPGWPEYFKSFTADNNGVAYGGTSAYRLIRISGAGKDVKAVPVY